MLQAFTIPSPATPKEHPRLPMVPHSPTQRCSSDRDSNRRTIRRTSKWTSDASADGRAVHKQADERRISDASATHQRCTRDRATARGTRDARVTEEQMDERCTSRCTSRWTSDGPAERPAMDQRCRSDESSRRTHDARATEQQRDARCTSDGPAMHERQSNTQTNDGRASHGPRHEQTRERRTMDDREMRQLYHHRLERLVEIAPNSHRYACCTCFASVIHTEEEELHSHKLHRDKGTIDDGIHAIPHGLDAITAISSISALLLPLQSLHYVQPMEKNARHCKAVQLQLQSPLNSQ